MVFHYSYKLGVNRKKVHDMGLLGTVEEEIKNEAKL